jgi:hypothetical protein
MGPARYREAVSSVNPPDRSLTEVGWSRAHRLAELFAPPRGPIRTGLARPTAIYAAGANSDGDGERTRETLGPLAERLRIGVDTHFGKSEERALDERFQGLSGRRPPAIV